MIVKIWSLDKTIKKLAVVATFDAIKKKAIEFGICCNGDIKVCKRISAVEIMYLAILILKITYPVSRYTCWMERRWTKKLSIV